MFHNMVRRAGAYQRMYPKEHTESRTRRQNAHLLVSISYAAISYRFLTNQDAKSQLFYNRVQFIF